MEATKAAMREACLQADQHFLMEAVARHNALDAAAARGASASPAGRGSAATEGAAASEAAASSQDAYAVEREKARWLAGATGVAALLCGSSLVVAHLGDSEAVLCRHGKPVLLTRPHRPTDPAEQARIREAGGWVTGSKKRVNGVLAVSRAFGDIEYKLWKHKAWGRSFTADLVSGEPTVSEIKLRRGDSTLVVASDGLWDVLGKAEVLQRVEEWRTQRGSVQGVAQELAELAVARGNNDNTTLYVVGLSWEPD